MKPTKSLQPTTAKTINQQRRKSIALSMLRKEETITNAANTHNVSRKFIHAQKDKAIDGVNQSFQDKKAANDNVSCSKS